jgi:DNA-3-methyladenine glycosylase I
MQARDARPFAPDARATGQLRPIVPQGNPPKRRPPRDLAGYLEAMTRAVFQAGISWRVVDAKWDGIREAFSGFDPHKVADLDASDIDELMSDSRVIRNRAKLEATVDNAQTLLELDAEHGGFRRYLRSRGGFEGTVKDLKKQFRFLGDTSAYYFLYVVGEKVPAHEEWSASHPPQRRSARSAR